MKGLEQRRIHHSTGAKVASVQALVDWSQEGQRHHSILQLGGGLSSCRTQTCIRSLGRSLKEELGLCFIAELLFLDCFYFFCSCIPLLPLRTLVTETCSRASIMARLRSQNSLGQNGLCQESHAWLSFSRIPHPICLQIMPIWRRNRTSRWSILAVFQALIPPVPKLPRLLPVLSW